MSTVRKSARLFIAGHNGMVGKALVREAERLGFENLLLAGRKELDLLDPVAVDRYYAEHQPEAVIVAAARVGGIFANKTKMADFYYENSAISNNLIRSAHRHGAARLLFLGSSCIYPREAPQPMPENCLLTSALEQTNEGYALAKITGLKYCQYLRRQYGLLFHSAMPTNLYGPGDNYHPEDSHVIPGLMRRFHESRESGAPSLVMWGTGTPRREFLHVDDLAAACFHLLTFADPPDWVNVGTGEDLPILELARLLKEVTGYQGEILTDPSRPDGTPRKLMDVSLMNSLGWKARIPLKEGLTGTYQSFLEEAAAGTLRG